MNLTKEEKALARKLKEQYDMSWDKYQERFNGTRPLSIWPIDDTYPLRFQGEPKDLMWSILNISSKYLRPIDNNIRIEIGFKRKVDANELKKFEYLDGGLKDPIFQKDVIDKMLEICPDDFESIPVTLKNWNKKTEPFSIEGFYAINVLKVIKAIDENNTEIRWSDGCAMMQKYWFKDKPWQDGCDVILGPDAPKDTSQYPPKKLDKPCLIAIDALSGTIVWHPKLAKVIPAHPYLFFAHDIEVWKSLFTNV
ncbi:hypothetical protein [Candidatus Phycorickettsia trachydisci]|nr:hypothetical protein [Candidatus Phycorickettsia trachydisci]